MTAPLSGPLVGPGAERFAALELHGLVEQDFNGLGHSLEAVFSE